MVSLSKVMVSAYDNQTREGMTMTVPNQDKTTQEAHNRAVVCVIAGLTVAQAERISAVIIHEKNTLAPDARGTIATGKEQNISRMIGNGQDAAFESQPPKKKKKKKKKSQKNGKNKTTNKNKSKNKTKAINNQKG